MTDRDNEIRIEKLLDRIRAQSAELERMREAQRWIPVTERLPDQRVIVLAYNGTFNEFHQAWISGGVWSDLYGDFHINRITHWRPLPEPPKEGQSDG